MHGNPYHGSAEWLTADEALYLDGLRGIHYSRLYYERRSP